MIGRALLIWSSAIVVAVNVPHMVGFVSRTEKIHGDHQVQPINAPPPSSRSYVLKANQAGHFQGRFRINSKPMTALVDTGATFVTMNESTARNLGYGGNELRFRYEVSTANGKAKAARITLKSVEIGTVSLRNVDALVVRDTSMSETLIGMSFMKKLSSYSADRHELRLVN